MIFVLFIGMSYGQGVYFAVDSFLSNRYTDRNSREKKMFVARVLVGESCIGDSSMKEPPINPYTNEPYDSTTDQKKRIFVLFWIMWSNMTLFK